VTDYTPTVEGFLAFIRDIMGVPVGALPNNAPVIQVAYDLAIALVLPEFAIVAPVLYQQAVYNLAGSNLLNFAPDVPGGPTININGFEVPYFQALRRQYGMNSFVAGVVQSTSDEGTGESMLVADWFKNMTLRDLQLLKDPYGRAYLAIAQSAGPLWGIS
jgi:hypothetical protein